MSVDFVAIDFETANAFRGSPCAVGLVKVRDLQVVDEWQSLIRPPARVSAFDYRNVRIHGIRPADVADAPSVGQAIAEIEAFAGDLPLVAHNAAFDMGVLRAAAEAEGVPLQPHMYACTVQMSRRHFTLPSHSLPFSAEAAGAPMTVHHDALHDARACAAVAVAVLSAAEGPDFKARVVSAGVPLSSLRRYSPEEGLSDQTVDAIERMGSLAGEWVDRPATDDDVRRLDPVSPSPQADPSNSLYGLTVLFTGELGLNRAEAWQRAADCGAQPVAMLTASTDLLVVGGGFEARHLTDGQGFRSSVLDKVVRLQSRGMPITIATEAEFMQSVGGSWPPAPGTAIRD